MSSAPPITESRSAREVLTWSRGAVGPALRTAVDTLPSSMRHIAGYHLGWWDEEGRVAAAGEGGKAIRPALVLLAASAVGGGAEAALPAAVAVELAHNFSLLHDDVMDGDVTRRHRPTAWSVFGKGAAVLAGDALVTLAFDVLAGSGHPAAQRGLRMLSAAVLDLLEGQSMDLAFEERADVALPECLDMVRGKTAALLACAGGLGASFGDGDSEQIECLRAYGEHLGLAFQITDDLLGIWGDPAITGKPVFSDLRNRKKSLPVVAALASGTPAGRDLAVLYRRADPLTDEELVEAANLTDAAGGRAWSGARADAELARALGSLTTAGLTGQHAAELAALAHLVVHRDR